MPSPLCLRLVLTLILILRWRPPRHLLSSEKVTFKEETQERGFFKGERPQFPAALDESGRLMSWDGSREDWEEAEEARLEELKVARAKQHDIDKHKIEIPGIPRGSDRTGDRGRGQNGREASSKKWRSSSWRTLRRSPSSKSRRPERLSTRYQTRPDTIRSQLGTLVDGFLFAVDESSLFDTDSLCLCVQPS